MHGGGALHAAQTPQFVSKRALLDNRRYVLVRLSGKNDANKRLRGGSLTIGQSHAQDKCSRVQQHLQLTLDSAPVHSGPVLVHPGGPWISYERCWSPSSRPYNLVPRRVNCETGGLPFSIHSLSLAACPQHAAGPKIWPCKIVRPSIVLFSRVLACVIKHG